ncbi:MAG: DsbA family protein [Bifidobacteriaceae bacterium]|jgi:protein-disulfide isomerase|nr:DsbA family protein [Bifidobacteriaceae bacterium]
MASKSKSGKGAAARRNEDAARARAEAERLKAVQAAKERRTKLITIGIGAVVAVAVVVAVVLVLRQSTESNYDEIARPKGAIEAGAIVIGQDLAAGGAPAEGEDVAVVRVYSDYICPGCGSLERRLGAKFEELAAAGKIKLELQPVAFLDSQSSPAGYSSRATNAAMIVANYAPDKFVAFHAKLFETGTQPDEGTEGLTAEQLVELAQGLGVPADVTDRFADSEFSSWVEYETSQAVADGVGTTPSLWVGKSDGNLTLITNPGTINLDDAIAKVLDGEDPNK